MGPHPLRLHRVSHNLRMHLETDELQTTLRNWLSSTVLVEFEDKNKVIALEKSSVCEGNHKATFLCEVTANWRQHLERNCCEKAKYRQDADVDVCART